MTWCAAFIHVQETKNRVGRRYGFEHRPGCGVYSSQLPLGMTGMTRLPPDSHTPQQNHLLAALPAAERERLYPHLQLTEMPLAKVVYEPGEAVRYAYFPTDCIVSLLYVLEDGASTEISIIGNEGLIGVSLFMGGETTPSRAVVQSAGYAYRLLGQTLREEFHRNNAIRLLLLRYTQVLITQMA